MSATHANPTSNSAAHNLIKSLCAVTATCALVACSTVQQSTPASQSAYPPTQNAAVKQEQAPPRVEPADNKIVIEQTPTRPSSTPVTVDEQAPQPTELTPSRTNSNTEQVQAAKNTTQTTKPEAKRQHAFKLPRPVIVDTISRTGTLENPRLTEVSGMTASKHSPGVLYAINDSGNSATLYALSETGQHIGHWPIKATNRDWEDLDSVELNKQNYIVIGDTGDNLKVHRKSTLYLVAEPLPNAPPNSLLSPFMTINFVYEDGPRNVEAFAVHGTTLYLISKEPLGANGPTASRLYALEIPMKQAADTLTARFIAELPIPRASLESKLAASFVGVDLDHITAMDITAAGRTAYLLTYREVHKLARGKGESWPMAFQRRGTRIHSHNMGQTEALAIAPGRALFMTSENHKAPILAIPIQAAP